LIIAHAIPEYHNTPTTPPKRQWIALQRTPSNIEAAIANGVAFVLPTGILQQDFDIIDEQENHIVLTVRVPLDLIRDNRALWMALLEMAERPTAPAEPDGDLDGEG